MNGKPSDQGAALPAAPGAFPWGLVQGFLAVVAHGSVSRAAQASGLSQPTLSRQIAALEQAVGAAVFTRGTKGSQLTPAGQALVAPAQQMAQAAQALQRAATDQSQTLAGTVRVTASETICAEFLPAALVALREQHPELQLELVSNNAHDDLLDRQADIALRMVRPLQDSLVTRLLGQAPMGGYASPAYLARKGLAVAPESFAQFDWIGEDRGEYILRGMAPLGLPLTRLSFAVRSDSESVRWHALLQGMGIGFALDAQAARQPGLVRVLPPAWVPALPLWLTAAQELRSSARMRTVFNHLAQALPPLLMLR